MASGGPRSSREALSRRDYEEVRFVGVARLSAVLIVLQLMDLIHLPPPPPFECHSAQRCGIRSTSSRSSSRPPGMVGALVAASAMRHDRGSNQSVTGSHSYSIMSFSLTASTTSSGNTSASESFFTHSNVASATRSTSAAGTTSRSQSVDATSSASPSWSTTGASDTASRLSTTVRLSASWTIPSPTMPPTSRSATFPATLSGSASPFSQSKASLTPSSSRPSTTFATDTASTSESTSGATLTDSDLTQSWHPSSSRTKATQTLALSSTWTIPSPTMPKSVSWSLPTRTLSRASVSFPSDSLPSPTVWSDSIAMLTATITRPASPSSTISDASGSLTFPSASLRDTLSRTHSATRREPKRQPLPPGVVPLPPSPTSTDVVPSSVEPATPSPTSTTGPVPTMATTTRPPAPRRNKTRTQNVSRTTSRSLLVTRTRPSLSLRVSMSRAVSLTRRSATQSRTQQLPTFAITTAILTDAIPSDVIRNVLLATHSGQLPARSNSNGFGGQDIIFPNVDTFTFLSSRSLWELGESYVSLVTLGDAAEASIEPQWQEEGVASPGASVPLPAAPTTTTLNSTGIAPVNIAAFAYRQLLQTDGGGGTTTTVTTTSTATSSPSAGSSADPCGRIRLTRPPWVPQPVANGLLASGAAVSVVRRGKSTTDTIATTATTLATASTSVLQGAEPTTSAAPAGTTVAGLSERGLLPSDGILWLRLSLPPLAGVAISRWGASSQRAYVPLEEEQLLIDLPASCLPRRRRGGGVAPKGNDAASGYDDAVRLPLLIVGSAQSTSALPTAAFVGSFAQRHGVITVSSGGGRGAPTTTTTTATLEAEQRSTRVMAGFQAAATVSGSVLWAGVLGTTAKSPYVFALASPLSVSFVAQQLSFCSPLFSPGGSTSANDANPLWRQYVYGDSEPLLHFATPVDPQESGPPSWLPWFRNPLGLALPSAAVRTSTNTNVLRYDAGLVVGNSVMVVAALLLHVLILELLLCVVPRQEMDAQQLREGRGGNTFLPGGKPTNVVSSTFALSASKGNGKGEGQQPEQQGNFQGAVGPFLIDDGDDEDVMSLGGGAAVVEGMVDAAGKGIRGDAGSGRDVASVKTPTATAPQSAASEKSSSIPKGAGGSSGAAPVGRSFSTVDAPSRTFAGTLKGLFTTDGRTRRARMYRRGRFPLLPFVVMWWLYVPTVGSAVRLVAGRQPPLGGGSGPAALGVLIALAWTCLLVATFYWAVVRGVVWRGKAFMFPRFAKLVTMSSTVSSSSSKSKPKGAAQHAATSSVAFATAGSKTGTGTGGSFAAQTVGSVAPTTVVPDLDVERHHRWLQLWTAFRGRERWHETSDSEVSSVGFLSCWGWWFGAMDDRCLWFGAVELVFAMAVGCVDGLSRLDPLACQTFAVALLVVCGLRLLALAALRPYRAFVPRVVFTGCAALDSLTVLLVFLDLQTRDKARSPSLSATSLTIRATNATSTVVATFGLFPGTSSDPTSSSSSSFVSTFISETLMSLLQTSLLLAVGMMTPPAAPAAVATTTSVAALSPAGQGASQGWWFTNPATVAALGGDSSLANGINAAASGSSSTSSSRRPLLLVPSYVGLALLTLWGLVDATLWLLMTLRAVARRASPSGMIMSVTTRLDRLGLRRSDDVEAKKGGGKGHQPPPSSSSPSSGGRLDEPLLQLSGGDDDDCFFLRPNPSPQLSPGRRGLALFGVTVGPVAPWHRSHHNDGSPAAVAVIPASSAVSKPLAVIAPQEPLMKVLMREHPDGLIRRGGTAHRAGACSDAPSVGLAAPNRLRNPIEETFLNL